MRLVVTEGDRTREVEVRETPGEPGRFRVRLGEEWIDVDARLPAGGPVSLLIDGTSYLADVEETGGESVVSVAGEVFRLRVEPPGRRHAGRTGGADAGAGQRLVAPMPGRVVAVPVRPGQAVSTGTPLVVLEAMKMENEFRATAAGVVAEVRVTPGQAVNAGDLLLVVAPEAPSAAP